MGSSGVVVVNVEDVWKQYRYGLTSYRTLRHDLQSRWARLRGREDPNALVSPASTRKDEWSGATEDRFWALRGMSFDVEQGEIVGIIGRNGAGKSTLLKVMSRVTFPTRGCIRIKGRVASLLEVGTGFHPELTGRENVFLNGAILGMTKDEIRRKFDEIIDFSGVAEFIDTPVKRYSSGMHVRLAFAVAAHLEPEILIIDEVLAVGDAAFQSRCLGKMQDVANSGRTILFVSHNMGAVARLCSKAVWVERGERSAYGAVDEVVHAYLMSVQPVTTSSAASSGSEMLSELQLVNARGEAVDVVSFDAPLTARLRFQGLARLESSVLALRVTNSEGVDLFTSWDSDAMTADRPPCGIARCALPSRLLKPGDYTLTAFVHDVAHSRVVVRAQSTLAFRVTDVGYSMNAGRVGVVAPVLTWGYEDGDAPWQ
jgi:homopolymeric O-antigen transport system ATP-binding protein